MGCSSISPKDSRHSCVTESRSDLAECPSSGRKSSPHVTRVGRVSSCRYVNSDRNLHVLIRLAGQRQNALSDDLLIRVTWNILHYSSCRIRFTKISVNFRPKEGNSKGACYGVGCYTRLRATQRCNSVLLPIPIGRRIRRKRIGGASKAGLRSSRYGTLVQLSC